MRITLIIFLSSVFVASAQKLRIESAVDSSAVPFAVVVLKTEATQITRQGDANGVVDLSYSLKGSQTYDLSVFSFGYKKTEQIFTGADLLTTPKIVLRSSELNLDEVVITTQYEPTSNERAVQSVKIISSEKIKNMAAVNLRDVLTNQLNVRMSQDNILGSGMSLQGLSGENVKILVDGVPLIGRLNGNVDLSQINLNDVERIELVEGPLSVQYGTNALAGTINLITKKNKTGRRRVGVVTYYESVGTYNALIDAGFGIKKNSFTISGGRNYFDGWNDFDRPFQFPKVRPADSLRFRQWKPKEQYFGNASWSRNLKRGDVTLKSSFFNEMIINRGYPKAPYGENAFDDHYATRRIDNLLSLNYKTGNNWNINALGAYNYYNRIKTTHYRDLTTLHSELSANPSDHDTSGFTLLMSRATFVKANPSSKLNYELGYDLNYESATGKRIIETMRYLGDYAVFVTSEIKPVSSIIVKPGLRYAYNTSYTTPLIPSLNVKYNLSERHVLRGGYARGFRAPSIKELYFLFVDINHNIVGNGQLRAEQSNNFNLAYNYTRAKGKHRLKLGGSAFYNSVFNLITLAQISGTEYSYVNIGRFKTLGSQLNFEYNTEKWNVQSGFNYTGRYNELSKSYGLPDFMYSPEVLLNGAYKLTKFKTRISLFYKYTGKLQGYGLANDQVILTEVGDHHLLDATITKELAAGKVQLSAGCKNLLNVTNINTTTLGTGVHSSGGTSMPLATGRNYFIKLGFQIANK